MNDTDVFNFVKYVFDSDGKLVDKLDYSKSYNDGYDDGYDDGFKKAALKLGVDRIIFSTSEKNGRKVLTTVVFFDDGSKCTVQNSAHDSLILNEDGTVSEASKEAGIAYAFVKRMFGTVDEKGNVAATGFGKFMRDLVTDAYDTITADKKAKEDKAKRQEEHKKRQEAAKAKKAKRKPSLAMTVDKLANIVEKLDTKLALS